MLVLECGARSLSRRQQPPHAQHALHARRARRRAHRGVSARTSTGRICSRSPAARTDERLARLTIRESATLGDGCRPTACASSAAARHAASRAHQRVLPRRRQGADERVLRRGGERSAWRSRYDTEVRRPRRSTDGQFPLPRRVANGGVDMSTRRRLVGRRLAAASNPTSSGCAKLGRRRADNFIVRGTPYNTGDGAEAAARRRRASRSAIRAAATPSRVDARAPKFDGGIVTRLDCVSLGIVVNKHGERFYDEGEDFWPKRYAIWGRLVARAARPDRVFDHRRQGRRPLHAVGVSAGRSGVDRASSPARSADAERARGDGRRIQSRRCVPGTFDHTVLDDCRTEGLTPAEDALGAARSTRRRSTAIRCGPASRSPISASRSTSTRAVIDARRRPCAERVRGGRDHGGQRPRQGLRRRRRHDDRHRVRTHRRARRRRGMPASLIWYSDGAARDGDLQRLPLLRGLLRGVSGDGAPPDVSPRPI